MSHLFYLMFRCDFDVMESLKNLDELERTKRNRNLFGRGEEHACPLVGF